MGWVTEGRGTVGDRSGVLRWSDRSRRALDDEDLVIDLGDEERRNGLGIGELLAPTGGVCGDASLDGRSSGIVGSGEDFVF